MPDSYGIFLVRIGMRAHGERRQRNHHHRIGDDEADEEQDGQIRAVHLAVRQPPKGSKKPRERALVKVFTSDLSGKLRGWTEGGQGFEMARVTRPRAAFAAARSLE